MSKPLILGLALALAAATPVLADDSSAAAAGYALGKIAFWVILIGVGASRLFGWGRRA